MNHRDLRGMDAAHAFEPERARRFCPLLQAFHVADVAVHRINRLHTGCARSIDQARAPILRLTAFGSFHNA